MSELYLDLDRILHVTATAEKTRVALELSGRPVMNGFRLTERGGDIVHWTAVNATEGFLALTGNIEDRWRVTAEVTLGGHRAPRAAWAVTAVYIGEEPCEAAFDVTWRVHLDDAEPFVPGIFYGENRPAGKGSYPRWCRIDNGGVDCTESPAWRFRSDRTMTPLAMLRSHEAAAAIVTTDRFSHGMTGLGFSCDDRHGELSAHFPFREEPMRYSPYRGEDNGPMAETFTVRNGESVTLAFSVYAGFSGWRPLLRDLYQDEPESLNPWMPGAQAAELAAYGLRQWHLDPERALLYETAGFDRYFRTDPAQWDRKHMHIAWVSGIPYAYALARHGEITGDEDLFEAGLSVVDKVTSEALAPAGMFYPQWTEADGWTGGWVQDASLPPVAQSRTIGEATWFLMQAIYALKSKVTPERLELWERAAQSNLDFALRIQRDDGSFGTYYDVETGEVVEWDGAGGLMWIPALLLGGRYRNKGGAASPNATAYYDAALKAGDFYAKMVRTERLAGAPEDVPYGVTSEDGYNALIAMMRLYEETGDEKWCELATHAADYTASFRMSYNTHFPDTTLLGRYDFRTKGGDIASPSNQHLHNYGYISIPAMLRLWRVTGDDYLFYRARDHVFCFRQFIARDDGDFNARKGMVPEQWYHTDWTHPKGYVLPLAHSWCAGWIVWVEDWLQSFGTMFVHPLQHKVYLLESVEIVDVDWPGGTITLRNPWDRDVDIRVLNLVTEEAVVFHLPANETHLYLLYSSDGRPVV